MANLTNKGTYIQGSSWVNLCMSKPLHLSSRILKVDMCVCLVAQSCPTLCSSMDCSPPGSSVHGNSPGNNIGMGCHAHFQGSSQSRDQTQASHIAGRIFTRIPAGVGSLSLLWGFFLTQEYNWDLLHCRQILYQLNYQAVTLIGFNHIYCLF